MHNLYKIDGVKQIKYWTKIKWESVKRSTDLCSINPYIILDNWFEMRRENIRELE